LKENGKMIEPSPTIPIFICSKIANFFRSKKHLMLQTMPNRQDLEILSLKVKSGNLKPIVASQYKLAEYRLAFSEMEKGGALGKIVVSVQ
jgi:NADPH:quinone reductase-like Zn-dependent oxidoreductase